MHRITYRYTYHNAISDDRNLYPHEFEKFVLVVPNTLIHNSFLNNLINSPLITVWFLEIILVTLVRIIFQKLIPSNRRNDWCGIFFNSLGFAFGVTTSTLINSRSERILVLFMTIFSLVSGIFCSGYLFQQFTTFTNVNAINSLDDLRNTNMDLVLPAEYLRSEMDTKLVT